MSLLALIKLAFERGRAVYVERALYYKLSNLEPRLLDDMGLKLENGKVVSSRPQPVKKLSQEVVGRRAEYDSHDYQSDAKGAGG